MPLANGGRQFSRDELPKKFTEGTCFCHRLAERIAQGKETGSQAVSAAPGGEIPLRLLLDIDVMLDVLLARSFSGDDSA